MGRSEVSVDSYKKKLYSVEDQVFEFDLDEDVHVFINDTKCVPVHAFYLDEDSPPFRICPVKTINMYTIIRVETCHFRS